MKPSIVSHCVCAPAGDADSGSGTASGTLAQAKQTIARTAREAASSLKSATADSRARVRGEAEKVVTEKRETAASKLGGYSSGLHDSARSFEERDPNIAHFTHRAADGIQRMADYVRSRDLAGLRDDAQDIARRHPAVFFGGLFFAGLVLGNVVKATRRGSSASGTDWAPEQASDAPEFQGDGAAYDGGAGSNPSAPTTDTPPARGY